MDLIIDVEGMQNENTRHFQLNKCAWRGSSPKTAGPSNLSVRVTADTFGLRVLNNERCPYRK